MATAVEHYTSHIVGDNNYLYLFLDHAKEHGALKTEGIKRKWSQLKLDKHFPEDVKKIYSNAQRKLPNYIKKRSSSFEKELVNIMNKTSYGSDSVGAADISPAIYLENGIHGLASNMKKVRENGLILKKAVDYLNETMFLIEKVDEKLSKEIFAMALEDPYIKQMLNISVPDGLWQVKQNTAFNETIQKNLETAGKKAKQILKILDKKGVDITFTEKEGSNLGYILLAIQQIISKNRGFLFEVETFAGALEGIKEGNYAVAWTGRTNKEEKTDSNIEKDAKEANALLTELRSIVSSIQTPNPKADLMFTFDENGVICVFGVSLKSISQYKIDALNSGSRAKKYAIDLGSSYVSLKEIFNKHDEIYREVIGMNPSWYGAQILTGWDLQINKEGDPHTDRAALAYAIDEHLKYTGSWGGGHLTEAWNQVVNLSAILGLTDALIGVGQQTTKQGYATYLAINNQVYRIRDVLKSVIKTLEQGYFPGIFGHMDNTLNRKWGQELQQSVFIDLHKKGQGPHTGIEVREAALKRSLRIWNEWDRQISKQNLKISISLGALKKYAGLSHLT